MIDLGNFSKGRAQGTTDGGVVSFMSCFDISGTVGDTEFVPYFVLYDGHGDPGGWPARETSASSFDGFISRSGGGRDFKSRPWRIQRSSRYVFLSFRQHTVVGHGITPSYAR